MTQPGEDLHEREVPTLDPESRDPEAPTADAFEQALPANPADVPTAPRVPLEANEADAVEQGIVVDVDEDYR